MSGGTSQWVVRLSTCGRIQIAFDEGNGNETIAT
jgi:hypothetical protein